jgi:hypothetical protein
MLCAEGSDFDGCHSSSDPKNLMTAAAAAPGG